MTSDRIAFLNYYHIITPIQVYKIFIGFLQIEIPHRYIISVCFHFCILQKDKKIFISFLKLSPRGLFWLRMLGFFFFVFF